MAIDSRISSFDGQPRSATSSRSNRLAKLGMEDPVQWAIAVICLLVTVVMQAEVALLFIGAGLIGILYYGSRFRRPPPVALQVAAVPALAQLAPVASGSTLGKLLLFFLKAGSLTFGSGLVIVPFLEQGLVQQYGWLDERQFLIAVAVGMISPGPVVITATFVGYLVAGFWGSLVSTIGIYGAKSAVYVDAFMNVIRWDNPAKLYDRYSREAS